MTLHAINLTWKFRTKRLLYPFVLLFVIGLSGLGSISAVPLLGNYTINAALATGGTNFQSFTAFADSINTNGISGNVTVTVVVGSGPYNEQVVIDTVTGASANATVTLNGNGETLSAITTSTNRHVLRLANVQYFTVNNLNILWNATSTGGFYGIHIFGTGNHITISNCSVDITGTTSTLYGAYVASGSETSILTTGDFHDITFTGNTSTGGGYGISLFGLVSNLASNILITDNDILNFHSNGVYLRETNGAVVSHNRFDKNTTATGGVNAIQLAQSANINGQIHSNYITFTQVSGGTATSRGIYVFAGSGHRVYNNVIHDVRLQSGNYTAIEVRASGSAPEIYFNTISLDDTMPTTGNLFGIKEELSNTNSMLRNNMISITKPTTGIKSGLVLASSSTVISALNSNYNNIWVPNGNVAHRATTTPTFYPNLIAWQSASMQDANSLSLDPIVVSQTLPQPTNTLLDNTGTSITWITTDILGVTRGVVPDIGAYEFSSGPPASPAAIIGDTIVCEGSTGKVYYISPVSGATTYNWTASAGATIVSGQGSIAVSLSFGTIPVTLSVVASNASGTSSPTSLNIVVNPLPVVSLTLPFDTLCSTVMPVALTGGLPLNGTYSGPGVSGGMFNPAAAGTGVHTIAYAFEDQAGCADTATYEVTVVLCVNVAEYHQNNTPFEIFPNPFSTTATLQFEGLAGDGMGYLMDETGQLVRQFKIRGQEIVLTREGLSPGLYLLLVVMEDQSILRKKVVIQ